MDTLLKKQESVSLSKATSKKRLVIHGTIVLLITVALSSMWEFGSRLLSSSLAEWRFAFAFALSSLSLFGTIVYYLKWNDQWFRQHAQAEFLTKRYQSDMIRATWVAELMAEWKKEYDGAFPESIASAFTKNLFVDDTIPEVKHPADALSSLLKNGEFELKGDSLKIKTG